MTYYPIQHFILVEIGSFLYIIILNVFTILRLTRLTQDVFLYSSSAKFPLLAVAAKKGGFLLECAGSVHQLSVTVLSV